MDGLKGFPEAIESIYPDTEIQHCVIHQIRNSMKYIAAKNQKAFMTDLKCVYKAATLNAAETETALDELEEKWGVKYPVVITSWRNKWPTLTTCFQYPDYVQKVIYTTDAVEAVRRQFRKLTKGGFANKNSLLKLLYAGIMRATERWTHPVQNWNLTLSQMAIHFGDRISSHVNL